MNEIARLAMLQAIQLHDQARPVAGKVRDVAAERRLPAEVIT
ncbi:MAG TPA: hypothetical protein VGG48_14490 [Rhizomicrobium sp.]